MKIKGYIDYRFHAPFIKASILIIDTGSTNTIILWKDL